MKPDELKARWQQEALLVEVREARITKLPPRGISRRDWYENFIPKEVHPFTNEYCMDLRFINLDGASFGDDHWFGEARLDNASFVQARIDGAKFQDAVLRFADCSHSHWQEAHCYPIYAHGANFSNTTIDSSSFYGIGSMRMGPANVTDLSSTNFQNCIATKTDFSSADFRRADLRGAQFIDCKFRNSDLRAIMFDEHTRFIRCDFHSAFIDEYFPYIDAFRKGMYDTVQAPENMDRVNWMQGIGLPS